ncbi:MAG: hypothetical protein QOH96_643 [Blastocatellia bacterium]|nr:hypothetical protein [Blastocatellia bacterium]
MAKPQTGIFDSLSLRFLQEILTQALPCSLFSTGKAARGFIFLFTVGALESILEYHSNANCGSDRTLDFEQDRRKAPNLYTSRVQFKLYGVKCLLYFFCASLDIGAPAFGNVIFQSEPSLVKSIWDHFPLSLRYSSVAVSPLIFSSRDSSVGDIG